MITTLFKNSLEISLSMSIVLIPLLLLSSELNKAFIMKWKYWLWLIVALRMALPFRFLALPARYTVEIPNSVITTQAIPSNALFAASPGNATASLHSMELFELLAILWLFGMALVAGFHLVSYWYCKKTYFRWSIRCADKYILGRAARISRSMGMKTSPEIYICRNVPCPMILGFTKQSILLPEVSYTHTEMEYILRHELVHMKRGDIWYKLALLIALAVHWYNPLSCFMLREATRDLEMLCDDFVVKGLCDDECQRYRKVILSTVKRGYCHMTVLSTGFHGSVKALQSRIQNLKEHKRRRGALAYLATGFLAILVSGAIFCLPASAAAIVELQNKTIQVDNGVRGIDVSSFQGDIDWEKVAAGDVHYTFVRATYGLEADEAFHDNAVNAKAAGLNVGAWHYGTFTDRGSMLKEAAFYLENLKNADLTLPAALCVDTPTELSKESMTGLCVEFMKIIIDAGYTVMLNTNTPYLEKYLDADQLGDTPIWIADYQDEPQLEQRYWQYTSAGTVSGIEGQVDINIAYTETP